MEIEEPESRMIHSYATNFRAFQIEKRGNLLFLPSLPFSKRPKLGQVNKSQEEPWLLIMIIAPGSVRLICSHKIKYSMQKRYSTLSVPSFSARSGAGRRKETLPIYPLIIPLASLQSLQASPIRSGATA